MRFSRVVPMGVLLLSALAGAQPASSAKGELNTISKLEVRGGTIEITGTRKPSFTTFTMTDPPRLVVDISEAIFVGVPDEMQVGNGVVTAIKTASYGTGEGSIARILVGFTKDVETDIQTQDGRMTVKVLGSIGSPSVGGGPSQGETVAANPGAGAPDAAAQRTESDRAAQQAARSAEQDRSAQEKAARDSAQAAIEERKRQEQEAKEAAKRAEQERLAQEKAAKEAQRAAAEEDKRLKAQEAKAAAEEKQRKAEEAKAAAAAEKQRKAQAAAEEKQRKAEEAKAAAAEEKQRKAEAAKAAAEEKQRKVEAAKAAAEEKQRKAEEAKAAAAAEKQRKAEDAKNAVEEKQRQASEAKVAAAEKHRREDAAVAENPRQQDNARGATSEKPEKMRSTSGAPPSVSSRRKTILFLGFQQEAGASRVFVRTNEPVRYSVSPSGKNALVVELENTAFGAANTRRALDTSFFETAVARVVPGGVDGKTARIQIQLKSNVSYEARQEGNEVILEFPRPPPR